jgi:hypothetical protein
MNPTRTLENLWWGARWGGLLGSVFMVFAVVVLAAKALGGNPAGDQVNVALLLAAYPVTGVLAGLIVGLFRPALRHRRGAMLVGMVAALPVSVVFLRLFEGGFSGWGVPGWIAAIFGAAWIGGLGGYVWWGQMSGFALEPSARAAATVAPRAGTGAGARPRLPPSTPSR